MEHLDKSQLEAELLLAQKEKVQAEIAVLKKTTPFTEGIKIIGSLVLGIGGAIVAIFGFQFAELKAEKSKLEASKAIETRDEANNEIIRIRQKLRETRDSLQRENDSLQFKITRSLSALEQLTDRIALAQSQKESTTVLDTLQQDANAAAIDLRASNIASRINVNRSKSLSTSIAELFAPQASVRGAAYNQLMTYHASGTQLIPSLLGYANNHMDNENGIYNTLVVLGNLDYKKVPPEVLPAVRSFAA